MPFAATVIRVMIASPSDVLDARDAVEQTLHEWNATYSESRKTVLLPWRWELNAVAVQGDHPQALINSQGVDRCDIVIGLFGSRLGSPTMAAVSGTVEEVQRAESSGTPVHIYFSTAPLPNDVDTTQLEGLRELRAQLRTKGLLGDFTTTEDLKSHVRKALEHDLARFSLPPGEVDLIASLEWHPKGPTPMFAIRNVGDLAAYQITCDAFGPMSFLHVPTSTLLPGEKSGVGVALDTPTQHPVKVRVTWNENGKFATKTFRLSLGEYEEERDPTVGR